MSDIREKALAAAAQIYQGVGNGLEAAQVAETFVAFLSGPQPAPSSTSATKPPGKPGRPRKTEEQVANEAIQTAADAAGAEAEGAEADEPADPKQQVKDAIANLQAKNKRKEAVALLKKYGAASATGVKPKDTPKFLAEVAKLLGDDEDSGDLTA